MPYIKKQDRAAVAPHSARPARTIGEVTFQIVTLINEFVDPMPKDYALYAQVVGALECAKQEVYRRVIAPYEDEKEYKNGDVFHRVPHDVWED